MNDDTTSGAGEVPERPDLPPPPPPGPGRITSPAQRLDPESSRFELIEPAVYLWRQSVNGYEALALIVPAGFDHDFASVPRPLWALISPIDLGLASIFHDWIYQHGGQVETLGWPTGGSGWEPVASPWSRRDTDRLFARIMREQGVPRWRRRWAFRAVHWFGGDAWRGGDGKG